MPPGLSSAWHMGAQPLRVLAPAFTPSSALVTLSAGSLSESDSPSSRCHPAGGALYAATVKNYLGTEPIISRAVGRAEDWIRTETLPSWLNGGQRGAAPGTQSGEAGRPQTMSVGSEAAGLPSPSLCCSHGLEPSRVGG